MPLGIFAKDPNALPVKTRMQPRLQPSEARQLYVACLADTIETACAVVASPVLFLATHASLGESTTALGATLRDAGLEEAAWRRLRIEPQAGADLGERLEAAFGVLRERPAFLVGSDSPALSAERLARDLQSFATDSAPDLVLGPTTDGGYYLIGCRRLPTGLLRGIAWSTSRALDDTRRRALEHGLRVQLLETGSDVDVPADLDVLQENIAGLRASGDARTARHSESVLQLLGASRPPTRAR